jgi:hypothetical protein
LLQLQSISVNHNNILNGGGFYTHGQIDSEVFLSEQHRTSTSNPHSTTHAQVAPGITYDHAAIDDFLDAEEKVFNHWQEYTPVWKTYDAGGGQVDPDLGDFGEIYGRARRAGQNLEVHIELIWGVDTDGGTGYWAFTLPDDGATPTPQTYEVDDTLYIQNGNIPLGRAVAFDVAVGAYNLIVTTRFSDMSEVFAFPEQGVQSVRSTVPFTWAVGDTLTLDFSYPVPGWGAA